MIVSDTSRQQDFCNFKPETLNSTNSIRQNQFGEQCAPHQPAFNKRLVLLWRVRTPLHPTDDFWRRVVLKWRKMTLRIWQHWGRAGADKHQCGTAALESVAQPTGRRAGRMAASASRGPRSEAVEGKGAFIVKSCLSAFKSRELSLADSSFNFGEAQLLCFIFISGRFFPPCSVWQI